MFGWLSWSIQIKTEGPHFVYNDPDLGVTTYIALNPGVYYAVGLEGSNYSILGEGTLLRAIQNALTSAGVPITISSDLINNEGPSWWRSVGYRFNFESTTATLQIITNDDSETLRLALGLDDYNIASETFYCLRFLWAWQGGLDYTPDLNGWTKYNEERGIDIDGNVIVIARKQSPILDITFSTVPNEFVFNRPSNLHSWPLKDCYNPGIWLESGHLVIGNDSGQTKIVQLKGLAKPIEQKDITYSVRLWNQLLNVKTSLIIGGEND